MPKIGANKLNFLPVCHKELGDEKSVDLCMTLFQLRNSLRFEINSFSEEDLFTHRVIQKKKVFAHSWLCVHLVGFLRSSDLIFIVGIFLLH